MNIYGKLSLVATALVFSSISCENASATIVTQTISGNPQYISAELHDYLYDSTIGSLRPGQPFKLLGFDEDGNGLGDDIGNGVGTGDNDLFAFSFDFNPFSSITSATLTLELKRVGSRIYTDQLSFADDWTQPNQGYGSPELWNLPYGDYQEVAFDLSSMLRYQTDHDHLNLSRFLLDGDLGVVFADDATIRSAQLTIEGTPGSSVPEPSSMLLLGTGMIGLVGIRKRKNNKQ